jgi:hypothetical protein
VKCLTADPGLRSLLYPARARRDGGKKNCRPGIPVNEIRIPATLEQKKFHNCMSAADFLKLLAKLSWEKVTKY